jgi:polar amino acid transport system permease protein
VPLTMVGALYLILTLISSALVNALDVRLPKTGLPLR